MKHLFLAFCLFGTLAIAAQEKFSPAIKQGSKLNYTATNQGQDTPVFITVDSLSPEFVKLGWNIEGLGNGGWVMKKKSLENATRGWWGEPVPGNDMELSEGENVLIFSKSQWDAIQKDKKVEYDMQTYSVKEPTEQQQLKLLGKVVDVIFLEGQNGSSRIWLLNNNAFPAIIKLEGNTMGPDISLLSVE
jgi:hypothetical protein